MRKSLFLALSLAVWIALIGGGPALAHARLLHANPKVGATVETAPREVMLSFSERLDAAHLAVSVMGPTHTEVLGPAVLDPANPRVLHAPLKMPLPPGAYRVRWRVTSEDSHETEGDFSFRVAE